MIEVKKEPEEFAEYDPEFCIFCKKETRYWYNDGEEPICPECAAIYGPIDINKIFEKLNEFIDKNQKYFYIFLLGIAFGYTWCWNALN